MFVRLRAKCEALNSSHCAFSEVVAVWVSLGLLCCVLVANVSAQAGKDPDPAPKTASAVPDLENASLEDLMAIRVYGASRYPQSTSEAPGNVTVITRTEIERYGYRTLADALRSVPGLFVTYDHQYSYLGVRGFANPGDYNTRILLMVDGHRLNDAIFEQALLGTEFPVDIDMVERIEVVRGPASSIYGTNAVFGVVNVITRKTGDLPGFELAFDAASLNSYRARASYGGTLLGVATVLSGTFYGSQGAQQLFFPEYAQFNQGIARNADGDTATDLLATLSFLGFTLQSIYGRRDKHDPTGAWGTVFDDSRNRSIDSHAFFDLQYERELTPTWSLTARTFYDGYNYDGFFPLPLSDGGTVLNRDLDDGKQWGIQAQLSKTLLGKHHLVGGVEYRDDFYQHLLNYDLQPPFVYQSLNQPSWLTAQYVQGEFNFLERIHLTAGLRHDQDARIGNSFNPRASVALQAWESGTVKLTFGTAFRSPNVYELYYAAPGSAPAMRLNPERIRTWEAGVEQRLAEGVSLTGNFFFNQMNDFISYTLLPDGSGIYRNLSEVTSAGAEISLNLKRKSGLMATLSYTGESAHDSATGQRPVGSPQHVIHGNISGPLFHSKLIGGLETQYLSSRYTLAGATAPGYAIVNATLLRRNIGGRVDLSASGYNLLNTAYYDPGAEQHAEDLLRQPGREFRVKLTIRLGGE